MNADTTSAEYRSCGASTTNRRTPSCCSAYWATAAPSTEPVNAVRNRYRLGPTDPVAVGLTIGILHCCAREADTAISRLNTGPDRKSTRLNSSHSSISYAVFCLNKKQT